MTEATLPGERPPAHAFRLAGSDDLGMVQALTKAAYAPYTVLLGYPPLPATEDHRPRIMAGQVHLAEVAGAAVGLLVLERHPDHAMIHSVAVLPARQGEGHGLALLRLAEHKARSWGVPELRLFTNALMERNIALYSAIGFQETRRRPHPKRPGFMIVDMTKPIVRVGDLGELPSPGAGTGRSGLAHGGPGLADPRASPAAAVPAGRRPRSLPKRSR